MPRRRLIVIGLTVLLAGAGLFFVLTRRPSADVLADITARVDTARVTFEVQRYEQAAELYKALAEDLNTPATKTALRRDYNQRVYDTHRFWMLSLLNLRRYDEAATVGQAYLVSESGAQRADAEFLTLYGNVRRLAGQPEEAAAQYQRALSRKPNYPAATLNYADLLIEQGQVDEARRLVDQTAIEHPEEALLVWMQARILELKGETEAAAEARVKALRLEETT